jgi:LysR family transcriptional regulator, transcriptional activator of the cysJI operon
MNLRHFKIFLTVCDAGSMTRAAEIVYMTQPSVSQVIAELEKEYGVRLFERLNHRLYLTATGEHLRSYANHIVNLSEQVRKELVDLTAQGSIRIGASLTIGAHLLPGIINAYRQKLPEVEIFTQVDNTSVIEKLIVDDRLDLGLVEGPVYSPHIREEVLCEDDLVIICGPGHPFWDEGAIEINMLAGKSFIIREQGSGTRDIFERVMSGVETNWKITGIYNNTEAIKQAVRENLGLAVVSKISVKDEVERGLVRVIEVNGLNLKRNFNLVYHRQKFFTIAMQTFIQVAKTKSLMLVSR